MSTGHVVVVPKYLNAVFVVFDFQNIVDINTFIYGVNHGHKMANSTCI